MLVAEEMSIKKAAQLAYVTDQCVSDHIKRLEKQCGVMLFTRRPRFQLTPAGKLMYETLQKIRLLETNMNGNLNQMTSGTRGSFAFGINVSRAQVILPLVLPVYYREFPDVSIEFFMDDTIVLEERLLKGEIDLFLGINPRTNNDFNAVPLCLDEIRVIISQELLKKSFGSRWEKIIEGPADLSEFSHVPFADSYKTGAINEVIRGYLNANHIQLRSIYSVSDTGIQISLCASALCAFLCPKMLLRNVAEHNLLCSQEEFLYELPLKDMNDKLRVEVVYHRDTVQPIYIQKFIEKLSEIVPHI
jgi:DNA-binding transcriptional LysR family regulator